MKSAKHWVFPWMAMPDATRDMLCFAGTWQGDDFEDCLQEALSFDPARLGAKQGWDLS
ncbi:hypothetical protein [Prochlorothrix hollandica]|uniref:hypothetical protein n=1 Tax=Prochlorothrix hollandica TaxID=1223 RepID=UPI00333F9BCE